MSNINKLIQKHNRKYLKTKIETLCNCRTKNKCPLNNQCLVENVRYKATIRLENETKNHLGSTVALLKKDGTTILATLITIKRTEQNYRSIYGSLKIRTLNTK